MVNSLKYYSWYFAVIEDAKILGRPRFVFNYNKYISIRIFAVAILFLVLANLFNFDGLGFLKGCKLRSRSTGCINLPSRDEYFRILSDKQFPSIVFTQMVRIPDGSFMQGGFLEHPIHEVYISEFWIDKVEVTKGEWDQVCKWANIHGYDLPNGRSFGSTNHPVTSVSWYDSVKWLNAKSEMHRLKPAYYSDSRFTCIYRSGIAAPFVLWNCGFRLPTEAEWEKAGRGGLEGRSYSWGDSEFISTNRCNFRKSNLGGTVPVASYEPNGFGVYDMCGNVSEWCWDYWGKYPADAQCDPIGNPTGSYRVLRGGSWLGSVERCRVAYRYYFYSRIPLIRTYETGFRGVIRCCALCQ